MGYMVEGPPPGIFSGPTLSVAGTSAVLTPAVSNVRVTGAAGAPVTITLPTVAQGLQDGQAIFVVTFDGAGFPTQIVPGNPGGGDNIVGGTQWNLAQYNGFALLYARVAAGVANWLVMASNTFETYHFPLQPTLAAGAQGPIPLGTILVPQGPRYAHSLFTSCNGTLSGGSLTMTMTGLANPSSQTVSSGANSTGQLFAPGNNNRITVPNAGTNNANGTLCTASVSTAAGFAGATAVDVTLCMW